MDMSFLRTGGVPTMVGAHAATPNWDEKTYMHTCCDNTCEYKVPKGIIAAVCSRSPNQYNATILRMTEPFGYHTHDDGSKLCDGIQIKFNNALMYFVFKSETLERSGEHNLSGPLMMTFIQAADSDVRVKYELAFLVEPETVESTQC